MKDEKILKGKPKQKKNYNITAVTIIKAILYWTILMEFLVTELGAPSFIRFLNDALVLILLVCVILHASLLLKTPQYKWIVLMFGLFVAGIIVGIIGNLVSIAYVFWGTRNTFRFFVYFFACIIFLKREDIEKIMTSLLYIQALNIILALFQYFVLDRWSDDLGGVFGYGNTTGTCGLCCLLVAYYFAMYLNKKASIFKFIFATVTSMIIAAIAEQKVLYLLMVVVFVGGFLISRFSVRKVIGIILCVAGLIIGLNVLKSIAPKSFEVLTDIDEFLNYSQVTYEDGYRLPRIGSFSIIDSLFFGNNVFHKFFGFGLGNCDFSSIDLFTSDFYKQFGRFNYRWFTHQWMFLENGFVGIISMIGVWLTNGLSMLFYRKNAKPENRSIIDTSIIYSALMILFMWTGPCFKIDTGYIIFFGAAIGIAVLRDTKDEEISKKKLFKNDKDSEKDNENDSFEHEAVKERADISQMPDIHLEKGHWIND